MRILSLFAGIGSFEKALKNLGIPCEIVAFSEIDKYAVQSYCAVHNVDSSLNLGDISKIDVKKLPKDIDIVTHGSPCQDFSVAGKNQGGDKGSKTRSSLMWCTVDIVEEVKPKIVLWENVKNVISKKHRHNFDAYVEVMDNLGYNSYFEVLNAKDFGVPQNRERVFTVSIRKDIDNKKFKFPQGFNLTKKLKDVLEKNVDEKYYTSKEYLQKIIFTDNNQSNLLFVKQGTKKGYTEAYEGDSINITYPTSTTRRGRVGQQVAQTIDTGAGLAVVESIPNFRIRKLTPTECWLLMGFTKDDIEKAINIGISNTQLYKQAGNSIVVDVLEHIFKNIFNENGELSV